MDKPGIKGEPFTVQFDEAFNNRDAVLNPPKIQRVEIIKRYPFNWYRRLRVWLGLSIKLFECQLLDKKNNE